MTAAVPHGKPPSATSTRSRLRFRHLTQDDFERVAELWNLTYPHSRISARDLRAWEAGWDEERYDRVRLAVQDEEGWVVATGEISHMPWQFHPHRYSLTLLVDPASKRRGVRQQVYGRLEAELQARGAEMVRTRVTDRRPADIRFYARRGFEEVQRMRDSRLNVRSFDFGPYLELEERVSSAGVQLTTLAEEGRDDAEVRRRAYELEMALGPDVPQPDEFTPIPFEAWQVRVIDNERALPDAYFLAKRGSEYVGVSFCQPSLEEPGILWQALTGVRREVRGQGIATALKLGTIRFARENGYREIRTFNDVHNRPILSLNQALGFQPFLHWLELAKKVPGTFRENLQS